MPTETTDNTTAEFQDGVTVRTVIGAFFIGFVMMPGAIYMGLIAGESIGSAAEWVTVILFAEIARRSFKTLLSCKSPRLCQSGAESIRSISCRPFLAEARQITVHVLDPEMLNIHPLHRFRLIVYIGSSGLKLFK